jgi:hypothetical protein
MLRRNSPPESSSPAVSAQGKNYVPFPSDEEPFVLGYGTSGIQFYGLKESFYLPYGSLQAMYLAEGNLRMIYITDEVNLEGQGLHSLYAHIAAQRVKRVHEQGERYRELADGGMFIVRISRNPRIP